MRLIFLTIIFLFLLTGCGKAGLVEVQVNENQPASGNNNQAVATSVPSAIPSVAQPIIQPANQEVKKTVPTSLELKVAFAQQAPFGNWDALHEETCEEASMIIVAKYFKKEPLNETIMEQELQQLVKWETDNGYEVDLTAAETVKILKDYFGINARVEKEVTADRIKYELAQGNLVITPAAGRVLGNPNFRQPGPIYHMLVVKGYNSSEFITNDVGTRKGNGYKYKYQTLINAIHDWNPVLAKDGMTEEEMLTGQKVMVIVSN